MSLTPEEKRYFGQLFKAADQDKVGVVTGEVAVKFFERSGLPAATLGLIWEISDKDNSGFLTQQSFSVALRLIGQAQNGRSPEASLAKHTGPFPQFEGFEVPTSSSSKPGVPQPPKGRGIIPPLTPEDRTKFLRSWTSINPSGDLLDGERARDVFQKSRLPVEQLGQIWALTDTQQRGALDQTEFIVAMHLVQSMMSGIVKTTPTQLPSGLFEAAANGPPATSVRSQRQQASVSSFQSQDGMQQQFSGQRQTAPVRSQLTGVSQSNAPRQSMSPPMQSGPIGHEQASDVEWDIKPFEKANYDNMFNDLDKSRKGYITGEEAVEFFSQSKLPHDDLAKVWDLSDADLSGQLNKNWFAVAMHLIKGKLGGKELPPMLPASLIPPEARSRIQAPTASVFAQAQTQPPVAPSSAAADLFGLNDSFSAPPVTSSPPAHAFTDGLGSIDRIASPTSTDNAPQRRAAPPPPRAFGGQAAFIPSSSFGQSIQHQNQLPGSPQTLSTPQQQNTRAPAEQDLLSDAEPSQSRNLNNDSTEIANLNNQVASLSAQQRQTAQDRGQVEADMNKLSTQKTELTARLSQIRQSYDQEVKVVRAMQVEQNTLRAETRELLKEVSLLDASLDAVKQQHDSIGAQLEKDRAENLAIKERIKSANDQTNTLKATLEQVQKQAKQQRSLVAVNTKQLNTLEADHEVLNDEIEKVQAESMEEQRLAEEQQKRMAERERIAAIEQERTRAHLEQSRSALISPAISTASASTNPFHRVSSPVVDTKAGLVSPFSQIFAQSAPQTAPPSTSFGTQAASSSPEISSNHKSGHNPPGRDIQPINTDSDFASSYGTAPTTANSTFVSGNPISGFDHAFREPSEAVRRSQPDSPDESSQAQGARAASPEKQRDIVSPMPVTAHAQSWSDTDPFTSDIRVASPGTFDTAPRPLPAAVSNLALTSNRSDDGSVGTSVQAQAPVSIRETPLNSRPSSPGSSDFKANERQQVDVPYHTGTESATEEHELESSITPATVQQTLSHAPHDDTAAQLQSPVIPGAFPSQESQGALRDMVTSGDDESFASPTTESLQAVQSNGLTQSSTFTSRNYQDENGTAAYQQENIHEIDSSDDETIEQPRGGDFFSSQSANLYSTNEGAGTLEADTASTHTITQAADLPDHSNSNAPLSGKADDFDEFDDLEEAEEADEDDEGLATSFTTQTNDFETSFEPAGSAPAGFAQSHQNILSTPALPHNVVSQGISASPARDFSEFAHYGSVLGAPTGLAPAIEDYDGAPSTAATTSSPPPPKQSFHQGGVSHNNMNAESVPAPPSSRHGAFLPPKRPEPVRTITAADDPMLTELTDMGFDRTKSLQALEKFNYDLGAATDWLLKGN